MNGLNPHKLAAIFIFLMVAVTVVMDWVPTSLNRNIRTMTVRERLPSSIIHSIFGLAFAAANVGIVRWGVLLGAVWYSVVMIAAIRNWWIPYFTGVHRGEITPDIYSCHYARNVTILPRFKENPVIPDLQHMLIHLAVLCTAALSWWSFWLA